MPSTKSLFSSLFLIIALLLLTFAAYQQRTSLQYRIQMVLGNPEPVPYPLKAVFPESGSTISIEELELHFPGGPCFYLDNPRQMFTFEDIVLEINEFDYLLWTGYGGVMSIIDDWQYCFHTIKLSPGNYLFDLTIEKLGIDHFQWAFTVANN